MSHTANQPATGRAARADTSARVLLRDQKSLISNASNLSVDARGQDARAVGASACGQQRQEASPVPWRGETRDGGDSQLQHAM